MSINENLPSTRPKLSQNRASIVRKMLIFDKAGQGTLLAELVKNMSQAEGEKLILDFANNDEMPLIPRRAALFKIFHGATIALLAGFSGVAGTTSAIEFKRGKEAEAAAAKESNPKKKRILQSQARNHFSDARAFGGASVLLAGGVLVSVKKIDAAEKLIFSSIDADFKVAVDAFAKAFDEALIKQQGQGQSLR